MNGQHIEHQVTLWA